MAVKSASIFLIFLLISLASCKSHWSMVNSSLKTQDTHRYSEKTALIFSHMHTRAKCSRRGGPCKAKKDCCNGIDTADPQLACFISSGSEVGTCDPCRHESESCSDNECCFGLKCDNNKCVETDECIKPDDACNWSTVDACCGKDEYYCIIDADGKSYCSTECSTESGQCKKIGTKDGCCDGFYCGSYYGKSICFICPKIGETCYPEDGEYNCCGNLCDKDSETCVACVAPGATCIPGGDPCCLSVPCDEESGTCCLAENSECKIDGPTCCPGTKCDEDTLICTPECSGVPCKTNEDCCLNFICAELPIVGQTVCKLIEGLSLKNDTIL